MPKLNNDAAEVDNNASKRLIAYKHNKIIDFRNYIVKHIDKLTINQFKLMMLSCAKVKDNDTGNTDYTISFKEFTKLTGAKREDYKTIYKEAKALASLGVDVVDTDGNILIFKWLTRVMIVPGTGVIEYRIDDRLLPFYKTDPCTKEYTKIIIDNLMTMRSKYALVLYELFSQWQNKGYYKQTVNQLKVLFEIKENEYKRQTDFINKCVIKAVEEINEKAQSIFNIEIEFVYGARKSVSSVIFHINKSKNLLEEQQIVEIEAEVEIIDDTISKKSQIDILLDTNFSFTPEIIVKIKNTHPENKILMCYKIFKNKKQQQNIPNPEGYFLGILNYFNYEEYLQKEQEIERNKNNNIRQQNEMLLKLEQEIETELMKNIDIDNIDPKIMEMFSKINPAKNISGK
ncbi:MAG: replication initiation protein [Patescibacteria group bacterium]|jgi:plasmid replication initiation protein